MDEVILIGLRTLHLVFGVFWAGGMFFMTLLLEPKLRALGPTTQPMVMRALVPTLVPTMTVSALVTITAGVGLGLYLRWGALEVFVTTSWGRMILLGTVTSVAALLIGIVLIAPIQQQLDRLGRQLEADSRALNPHEGQRLHALSTRLRALSRTESVLLLIAVVAMASARFV